MEKSRACFWQQLPIEPSWSVISSNLIYKYIYFKNFVICYCECESGDNSISTQNIVFFLKTQKFAKIRFYQSQNTYRSKFIFGLENRNGNLVVREFNLLLLAVLTAMRG